MGVARIRATPFFPWRNKMDTNVIPFDRDDEDAKQIIAIETRLENNEASWTDDSILLAVAYASKRDRFPGDREFGAWRALNNIGHRYNADDQAALIGMGRQPDIMREVLLEAASRSYQLIWRKYKDRFRSVTKAESEPTLPIEIKALPVVAQPTSEPAIAKPALVATPNVKPAQTYAVPKSSALRDQVGDAADVLHARFKHRVFHAVFKDEQPRTGRLFANYIAKRCQEPDYPSELLLSSSFSLEIIYPYLPKRILSQMPTRLGTLKNEHSLLAETERLFMLSPEFGITDPPMVGFNKAMAIYQSLKHKRAGGVVDTTAVHKPTYEGDEGRPPVIIRGMQVWPAATGAGYCYDDLRCAWGFADDIVKTFDETRNAPVVTRGLKLRHLMSWLGGYNSKGATILGTVKALEAVVQAYSGGTSEEMKLPAIRMDKLETER